MHWSATSVNRIVTSMNELKQQCASHCNELKQAANRQGLELTSGVAPHNFSGVVAAVDSGFSSREFVSLDVLLLRSVASVFTYENSALVGCDYFPNRVPGISVHYGVFPDAAESACFKSLSRLAAELNCALQTARLYNPALLFIDGSLLPLASDKPPANSSLQAQFDEVLSLYGELFATCAANNCELVGVVKDSRSQKLCNLLQRKLNVNVAISSDELLCNFLLSSGQRTMAFKADESAAGNARQVHCFYLKAGGGLPYRVEFIASGNVEEHASLLASKLCGLGSPHFSYPSILIEVDMRAALTPGEISALFSSIENRQSDFILRSNNRPFRS